MPVETCIGLKLRPEILSKWKKEATQKHHEFLLRREISDASSRATRNPTRQIINEEFGKPEVECALQWDFCSSVTNSPKKKRNLIKDLIKRNKESISEWSRRRKAMMALRSTEPRKRGPLSTFTSQTSQITSHLARQAHTALRSSTPTSVPPTPLLCPVPRSRCGDESAVMLESAPPQLPSYPTQSFTTERPTSGQKQSRLLNALMSAENSRPVSSSRYVSAEIIHPPDRSDNQGVELNVLPCDSENLTTPKCAVVGSAVRMAKTSKSRDSSRIHCSSFDHIAASCAASMGNNVLIATHRDNPTVRKLHPSSVLIGVQQRSPIYFCPPPPPPSAPVAA